MQAQIARHGVRSMRRMLTAHEYHLTISRPRNHRRRTPCIMLIILHLLVLSLPLVVVMKRYVSTETGWAFTNQNIILLCKTRGQASSITPQGSVMGCTLVKPSFPILMGAQRASQLPCQHPCQLERPLTRHAKTVSVTGPAGKASAVSDVTLPR